MADDYYDQFNRGRRDAQIGQLVPPAVGTPQRDGWNQQKNFEAQQRDYAERMRDWPISKQPVVARRSRRTSRPPDRVRPWAMLGLILIGAVLGGWLNFGRGSLTDMAPWIIGFALTGALLGYFWRFALCIPAAIAIGALGDYFL
jgi:hypothetical protein